jgi:glycerophosphoryl diester phosphodiesterase
MGISVDSHAAQAEPSSIDCVGGYHREMMHGWQARFAARATAPLGRRACGWREAIFVLACIAGCGGEDTAPPPEDGEPPILEPSLFDCSATSSPERTSTTPIACGLDPECRTPQVTGHRGAGGQLGKIAPENTLAAYRAAIALGVDYVETDPRPTSDGIIVNIHDDTVDRTTDGSGDVAEMTFDEVRALHIDASGYPGDYGCEKVPTLEEVLETCKDEVVVLVDANKTDRVDLLVEAIQSADAVDWALFDTSSVEKIDEALALEPSLHIMIRVDTVAQAQMQLDHFANHPPAIVEIDSAAPIPQIAEVVHGRNGRTFTDVFPYDIVVNLDGDASHYGEIFTDDLDIVQTDRPDKVLEFLGRR